MLCDQLGLTGEREPVVAGQSWGGNVVLTLAAEHGGVAAVALVDGGWIWLGQRYPTFEQCWAELAPQVPRGLSLADLGDRFREWFADFPPEGVEAQLANLTEDADGHARRAADPRAPQADPALAVGGRPPPAVPAGHGAGPARGRRRGPRTPTGPARDLAASLLPDSTTSLYVGAHHDLHAQQPDRMAADLLALAARAEAVVA